MKRYFSYGLQANDRDLITSVTKVGNTTKRYFSSLDAEIYFGGERILDIYNIEVSYEEQVLPMYGFNSFMPSKMFRGQKIIQGTFTINFTEVGYLVNLLNRIPESSIANKYDKVGITCDEGNAPMFAKEFDILLGYGGYNNEEISYNATSQIVQGAHITSYKQVLDTSGEPILEMYSFIARNIKVATVKATEGDSSNNNTSDKNASGTDSQNFSYEVLITTNPKEIKELEDKAKSDKNLLGIVGKVYTMQEGDTLQLVAEITQKMNSSKGDKIENVKVNASDNHLKISKTYSLESAGENKWVYKFTDSDDITKFKKATSNKQAILCSVEFSLFREATGSKYKINKQSFIDTNTHF